MLTGISLKDKTKLNEIRKNIGIVFQNPENQIIFDKVYDDLKFGLQNLNFSKDEIERNIDEALKSVNMLKYKNSSCFELSLGQKQKIAIAGCLAIKPKILILDEPTTMLDPISKNQVYNILQNLKQSGITIIYLTNFIDEILLCDKTIIFENGKIKKIFEKKDLLNNLDFIDSLEFPGIISLVSSLHKFGIDINLENLQIDELTKKIVENKIQKNN
ncbi:MAG: ATP-binding cassette domain-containing protein [Clostridia bacterium]|nr:ATP-binding cassette domain-containing protein [Clostridia bacterium]